jgi:hypothetical protein
MTNPPDTLVTPVEVHRARLRLTPVRSSGTLRFESGHVAFEGSDGRQRFRVPVDQVTDVVRHRSGFAFWATFAGRRCFVILRRVFSASSPTRVATSRRRPATSSPRSGSAPPPARTRGLPTPWRTTGMY